MQREKDTLSPHWCCEKRATRSHLRHGQILDSHFHSPRGWMSQKEAGNTRLSQVPSEWGRKVTKQQIHFSLPPKIPNWEFKVEDDGFLVRCAPLAGLVLQVCYFFCTAALIISSGSFPSCFQKILGCIPKDPALCARVSPWVSRRSLSSYLNHSYLKAVHFLICQEICSIRLQKQ